MADLALIVARADNGVIGRDNGLPWHLPEDLRYFKRVTLGKPVVMGRKTFESIGCPLPGRRNIVVSRNPAFDPEGVTVAASLDAALVQGQAIAAADGASEVMVIGGAEIYRQALPLARRLYLTEVHAEVVGDATLEAFDLSGWRQLSRDNHAAGDGNPYPYSFVVYERA